MAVRQAVVCVKFPCFAIRRWLVAAAILALSAGLVPAGIPAERVAMAADSVTARISTDVDGVQGNRSSETSRISGSGRYVAFTSLASNLVLGDVDNDFYDIYLRDRVTNAVTLVSVAASGGPSDGSSFGSGVSDDGRYVVFESEATNIIAGDTNRDSDIFVRDLQLSTEGNRWVTSAMLSASPS